MSADDWDLWRAFLAVQARLSLEVDRRLRREHDLSAAEYGSLAALLEAGGRLRVADLSAQLGWEKSRTSHLIARMEQRGLISRERAADDGRSTEVMLSPLGSKTLLGAVRSHADDVRELFLDRIEPHERTALAAILDRVLADPAAPTPAAGSAPRIRTWT